MEGTPLSSRGRWGVVLFFVSLIAILLAYGYPLSTKAPLTPRVCFEDGHCLSVWDVKATSEQRSDWENWCRSFRGKRSGRKCPQDRQNMIDRFPDMAKYAEDLASVYLYVISAFQIGPNKVIRDQPGQALPLNLKTPIIMTGSGLGVLRRNTTIQQYSTPIVYRGEDSRVPNTRCKAGGLGPSSEILNNTHTSWGFDSTSLNLGMTLDFAAEGGVVKVIKQDHRVGTYIWPIGIPYQYEVVMPPGVTYKTIACEQRQINSRLCPDVTYSLALEYMYDMTLTGPMQASQEWRELDSMRRAVDLQLRGCWPWHCQHLGGTCTGQSDSHDPNRMIPDSHCEGAKKSPVCP